MDELVKKIDSYHLFNYLVPGVVATECILWLLNVRVDLNAFSGFFVFYFVGLVISRIGSIIVEPILRATGVVRFKPYGDYLKASKKDDRLELMSQENNAYRTYVAMCVTIVPVFVYACAKHTNHHLTAHVVPLAIILAGITMLMVLAYRKQTGFVTKRIGHSS